MFSALIKAFTGRAGFLSSLLALLLIVLTSAAVLLSLPRIEQSLEDSGQSALSNILESGDTLIRFRAEGRNLLLEGEFADEVGLSAKLKEIEGVRSVIINGLDAGTETAGQTSPEPAAVTAVVSADSVDQDTGAEPPIETVETVDTTELEAGVAGSGVDAVTTEVQEADVAQAEDVAQVDAEISTASGEPLAQLAPESAVGDESVAEDEAYDQSLLSLRYDGTQLSLSGHLADEQMAQLIADRVANVIPARSVLEINVDGDGKGSPLNWMREFLETVAGLPDDAQGKIEGSDREGVNIIPDTEQTLSTRGNAEAASSPSEDQPDTDNSANNSAERSVEVDLPEVEPATQAPSENTADVSAPAEQAPDSDTQVTDTDTDAEASEAVEASVSDTAEAVLPTDYITGLNLRIAEQAPFESGEHAISEILAAELDGLAEMMQQNQGILLRVVGNIDFDVDRRYAEFVGIDRAREVKKYLYLQGTEPFRIFATPLPRDRAYDKRVQLVFYISE